MLRIATHDSATGEKPANILSWLVIPFSRTQNKTISEQIEYGVRMFDLRAKSYKSEYHAAHGLFITKRTLEDIIAQINSVVNEDVYVTITYESKFKDEQDKQKFIDWVHEIKKKYNHITWGGIAVKYTDFDTIVDWKIIEDAEGGFASVSKFVPLDGKTWQTYLPIPWLWDRIYSRPHEYSEDVFTYYDFV